MPKTQDADAACPHCGKKVDDLTLAEMAVCDKEVRKMFVNRDVPSRADS